MNDLADVDLVIEAATEDYDTKVEMFRRLDEVTDARRRPGEQHVVDPDRRSRRRHEAARQGLGMHFFNPVPVMGLIELVKAITTADETIEFGRALRRACSARRPCESRDRAGFIVNMLLIPYLNGAIRMLEEGFATREDIDTAMHLGLNHPMGPLQLIDLIGLDTHLFVANVLLRGVQGADSTPRRRCCADGHGRPSRPQDRPRLLRLRGPELPSTRAMPICPSCGIHNSDDARFCSACGARLAQETALMPEVRKTVTIVFCDVVGSTSLAEGLDAETWGQVMVRYFDAMRRPLERHGGTIEKFIGDAVMAVFGMPLAREDDALRAVRAAQDMRIALGELNEELDVEFGIRIEARTGIHTGEIVAAALSADQALPLGDAANTAARFEQAAGSGEILLGEPTYRLVRDAVRVESLHPLELKGKAKPVSAWRLTGRRARRAWARASIGCPHGGSGGGDPATARCIQPHVCATAMPPGDGRR